MNEGSFEMSELQNRRYKEVTPEETVKRLKKILEKMQNILILQMWVKVMLIY